MRTIKGLTEMSKTIQSFMKAEPKEAALNLYSESEDRLSSRALSK